MVVGEPTLMGGEFGDEDERLITRLENSQFDAAAATAAGLGGPPEGSSGPDSSGSGGSLNGPMGPMGGDHSGNGPHMGGKYKFGKIIFKINITSFKIQRNLVWAYKPSFLLP